MVPETMISGTRCRARVYENYALNSSVVEIGFSGGVDDVCMLVAVMIILIYLRNR